MEVVRTERGWAGHFCGASNCLFRRNTLLECGDTRIVVSTVGLYLPFGYKDTREFQAIGTDGRMFETMAFFAKRKFDRYWDADVSKQVSFNSKWSIHHADADDEANIMHENVVDEISKNMRADAPEDIDEK